MVDRMSAAGFSATLDESKLVALAGRLAQQVGEGGVIHLIGDLGAGKTTFARALLGALGVGERIKSPTYSLIESYMADDLSVHHLDLYRIAAPDELEWLGLADLVSGHFLLVTEWPERAGGALPEPDLLVRLAHAGARRALEMEARSARGERWLGRLASAT